MAEDLRPPLLYGEPKILAVSVYGSWNNPRTAAQIAAMDDPIAPIPLEIKENKEANFCFFIIHPITGIASFNFRPIADDIDVPVRIIALDSPFTRPRISQNVKADKDEESATMNDLAVHYIKVIKKYQEKGPYFIMGYSWGTQVLLEMAKILEDEGETLGYMGQLDCPSPSQFRHMRADDDDSTTLVFWIQDWIHVIEGVCEEVNSTYGSDFEIKVDDTIIETWRKMDPMEVIIKLFDSITCKKPVSRALRLIRAVKLNYLALLPYRKAEPVVISKTHMHIYISDEVRTSYQINKDWDQKLATSDVIAGWRDHVVSDDQISIFSLKGTHSSIIEEYEPLVKMINHDLGIAVRRTIDLNINIIKNIE